MIMPVFHLYYIYGFDVLLTNTVIKTKKRHFSEHECQKMFTKIYKNIYQIEI